MQRMTLRLSAVGLSLVAGLATTIAVRGFFDRPGESALGKIPADALLVGTIDLVPAPSQVLAFGRIQKALSTAGKPDVVSQLIGSQFDNPDLTKAIAKCLGRSVAVAVFSDGAKLDPAAVSAVGLISLKDPDAAQAAVAKYLTKVGDKTKNYYALDDNRALRVSDNYLEIATKASLFDRLDAVSNGKAKSLSSLSGFALARTLSEHDANIKVYFHQSKTWGVVSGSIEDAGLSVVVRGTQGEMDRSSGIANWKPLSQAALKKIPSGAYALIGLSQPSSLAGDAAKSAGAYQAPLTSAFQGDTVIGLYPSEKSPRAGVDLLLMMDGAYGAKPATAFKSLRKQVEKDMMDGQPIFGKPKKVGNGSLYAVTGQLSGMFKQATKSPVEGVNSKLQLKDKTFAYATDGETMYLGTSEKLMRRSIATADGTTASISKDAAYRPFDDGVMSGSQFSIAVSLPRIIEGIANTTTKGNDSASMAKQALGAVTHGDAIFSLSGGITRDGSIHGRIFVPINYTKLGKLISDNSD